MIRLGLIGYPLEHSLSPALHEAALRASGLQGSYSLYPVCPGDVEGLDDLIHRVRTGELTGLNVTIPHKQAIIRFLDVLTSSADTIGAINTIYTRNGKVIGDNTDAPGFLTDLDRFMLPPTSALVLGAGGAARAIIYALRNGGCSISVAARRLEQAEQLAQRFPGIEVMELKAVALAKAQPDLIVNATPAGMFPAVDECPWPAGLAFPEGAVVYDLIYNPAETQLIRWAHKAGLRATTGLGMLIEQARLAFELWTGCKVDSRLLWDAVGQRPS